MPQREKDLSLLRNAIPTSNDLPSVFATLANIAARSGVQLGSVAPVAPSAKRKSIASDAQPTAMPAGTPVASQPTQAVEILLSFDFKGTYEQTMTFLSLVQSVSKEGASGMSRLIVIDDLAVNAESGAVLQVAVTGRAFTSEPPVSGT